MSIEWILLMLISSFLVGWLGVRWLTKRGAAEYRKTAQSREQLGMLSISEAASQVATMVRNPHVFRYTESVHRDENALAELPRSVRELLRQFETLRLVPGRSVVLSRAAIGESRLHPGYIRIGNIDDDAEIGIRLGADTVFELYAGEPPDATFGTHNSIYHFLLVRADDASVKR
jgi:hypothetical protein